jgi:2-polyprenyl-3-methyl-5-hydroxy-6-metoxy-1,4-benzoquinol methylase
MCVPPNDRSSNRKVPELDYSIHYRFAHGTDSIAWNRDVERARERLRPLIVGARTGTALDLGCGTGTATEALRMLGFEVHGIERDAAQAQVCREHGVPVIETSDLISVLRARPSSADVILMLDVLEHLQHDEQPRVLRAACSALRSGGRVIIAVPNASSPAAMHRRYADWTHVASFTDRSLEFLLVNCGFSVVKVVRPGLMRRPPLRLWRASDRKALKYWLVQRAWRAVLQAELGNELDPEEMPPLGADLLCVASREQSGS